MTTTAASPTKLQNGTWGASVSGSINVGDLITITTRSGKSWDAIVDRVLWTGDSKYGNGRVSICATSSVDRPAPQVAQRSSDYEPCDECDDARGVVEATDSSGIRGMVCHRCNGPSYTLSFA